MQLRLRSVSNNFTLFLNEKLVKYIHILALKMISQLSQSALKYNFSFKMCFNACLRLSPFLFPNKYKTTRIPI